MRSNVFTWYARAYAVMIITQLCVIYHFDWYNPFTDVNLCCLSVAFIAAVLYSRKVAKHEPDKEKYDTD